MLCSHATKFILAVCMAFAPAAAFVGPNSLVTARRHPSTRIQAATSSSPIGTSDEASTGPTAEDISKSIAHPESVLTVDDGILKILPHRYPFALVDKVLHFEPGKRIVGVKCITHNEPQFTGHFPENPIMPGVLQV